MDAWETLISTSSLTPVGNYDAWEHLNAQEGGGVVVYNTTVLTDEYLLAMEDNMPDVFVEDTEFILEVDDIGLETAVNDTDYYIEVCNE